MRRVESIPMRLQLACAQDCMYPHDAQRNLSCAGSEHKCTKTESIACCCSPCTPEHVCVIVGHHISEPRTVGYGSSGGVEGSSSGQHRSHCQESQSRPGAGIHFPLYACPMLTHALETSMHANQSPCSGCRIMMYVTATSTTNL